MTNQIKKIIIILFFWALALMLTAGLIINQDPDNPEPLEVVWLILVMEMITVSSIVLTKDEKERRNKK